MCYSTDIGEAVPIHHWTTAQNNYILRKFKSVRFLNTWPKPRVECVSSVPEQMFLVFWFLVARMNLKFLYLGQNVSQFAILNECNSNLQRLLKCGLQQKGSFQSLTL